ncbi:MAG: hypothetical protein K2G32_01015 [Oscillospiraceae bacterium]|nr:hypothetical protein [Oscillospiraceae bacterium]
MENQVKTQAEIEQEMLELNKQFGEFLHTKGITAKFKLAFSNMGDSVKKQHEADKTQYEAVKAQSAEDNKEFVEFLHTKGLKAKFNLVVENIKKGAEAAPQRTAENIAKATAQAHAHVPPHPGAPAPRGGYTAESLSKEFNEFLKMKGLDSQYKVEIKGSDED